MNPFSCASSNASAIYFAIFSASSSGIAPRFNRSASVFPFDELRHQSPRAAGLFQAMNRRNIRMVQRSEDLGFPAEPRHAIRVVRKKLGDHFQRDISIELGVGGTVDLTHATLANLFPDLSSARCFVPSFIPRGRGGWVRPLAPLARWPAAPAGRLRDINVREDEMQEVATFSRKSNNSKSMNRLLPPSGVQEEVQSQGAAPGR